MYFKNFANKKKEFMLSYTRWKHVISTPSVGKPSISWPSSAKV